VKQSSAGRIGLRLLPWVESTADYPCGHSRAIALKPWAIRWGVADPGDLILRNFRCVMYGQTALIQRAGVQHDSKTYDDFPVDLIFATR
jgi:hypothetical protein